MALPREEKRSVYFLDRAGRATAQVSLIFRLRFACSLATAAEAAIEHYGRQNLFPVPVFFFRVPKIGYSEKVLFFECRHSEQLTLRKLALFRVSRSRKIMTFEKETLFRVSLSERNTRKIIY